MICNIKLFISFFILSLSFVSFYSKASVCPPVESIKRVKGEYVWETTEPGWYGYFVAPTPGKGRSYKIEKFISANWVKTSDSDDSAGFIQCQYSGNFIGITTVANPHYDEQVAAASAKNAPTTTTTPANKNSNDPQSVPKNIEIATNEIIRFVQSSGYGSSQPTTISRNWTCTAIVKFPNEACECFTDIQKCNFHIA